MPKNQPRCYCGASSVKRRGDITNAAVFTQFIEHCITAISLDDLAETGAFAYRRPPVASAHTRTRPTVWDRFSECATRGGRCRRKFRGSLASVHSDACDLPVKTQKTVSMWRKTHEFPQIEMASWKGVFAKGWQTAKISLCGNWLVGVVHFQSGIYLAVSWTGAAYCQLDGRNFRIRFCQSCIRLRLWSSLKGFS